MANPHAYWEHKTLSEMTDEEWEGLCDGCGRCCLHKLEDIDTGEILHTEVSCRLLCSTTARCSRYAERKRIVANCLDLREDLAGAVRWLPPSCAYRRLYEGRGLADWHPLISGTGESVRKAGVSVLGRIVNERDAGDYEDHVVDWPGKPPRKCVM